MIRDFASRHRLRREVVAVRLGVLDEADAIRG